MNDRNDATTNQPQIDSRANLFHLLEELSGLAGVKDRESVEPSPIPDVPSEEYQKQNGTVL